MSLMETQDHMVAGEQIMESVGLPCKELSRSDIFKVGTELLKLPQIECPLSHHFAPGVYYREVVMPKGSFVIGKVHKTEHLNVISEGHATVYMEGKIHNIKAPCVIRSGAGCQKILFMHEDTRWATVHVTNETDVPTIEKALVEDMTIPPECLSAGISEIELAIKGDLK